MKKKEKKIRTKDRKSLNIILELAHSLLCSWFEK